MEITLYRVEIKNLDGKLINNIIKTEHSIAELVYKNWSKRIDVIVTFTSTLVNLDDIVWVDIS